MTEAPSAGSDDLPRAPVAGAPASADASLTQSFERRGLPASTDTRAVPSTRSDITAAAVTLAGFAVLGLVGARLWFSATDLPAFLVSRSGSSLDEAQLGRYFNSPGWFLLIGLGLGLLGGLAFGAAYRRHGLVIVMAVFAGGLIASYLCYHYGVTLDQGPVGPRLHAAHPGERVPVELSLGADGVRLAWPIAALVGVLVAQYALWRNDDETANLPWRSQPQSSGNQ